MSTLYIFYVAIGVFALMITGIILTAVEFAKMEKAAKVKGRSGRLEM